MPMASQRQSLSVMSPMRPLLRWGQSTGKWAEKDMDHALELAQEAKVAVPLAALVDQLMKGMNQQKMLDLLK